MELDITILDRMLAEMITIAKSDGFIDADEQAIIEKTQENVHRFKELWDNAIADKIITDDELDQLEGAVKKIHDESQMVALEDQKFTPEEVKLVVKIANTLFSP